MPPNLETAGVYRVLTKEEAVVIETKFMKLERELARCKSALTYIARFHGHPFVEGCPTCKGLKMASPT